MIEINPTNTINNTLVFKINLPKKYPLRYLHLTTTKFHTWKIAVICLVSISKWSWAKTWYTQCKMLRKLGKDDVVTWWLNDWKIRTVDSVVVIISVGHFHDLHIEELWVSFGVGKHFRHIPVHSFTNTQQAEKSKAMMLFQAITTSSFLGKGKNTARSCCHWCLHYLYLKPEEVDPQSMAELERFIIIMFSRTCTLSRVDEARKQLFTEGSATIENIPPTKAVLFQYLKTAVYQAGYVWSHVYVPAPSEVCGWTASFKVLHCGCKKGCKFQRKYQKSGLQCTDLCSCGGVGGLATPDFNWGILRLKYYSHMSDMCISLKLSNYQLYVWGCF